MTRKAGKKSLKIYKKIRNVTNGMMPVNVDIQIISKI